MGDSPTLNLDPPLLGDETYHLRNPLLPVQSLRAHPHLELTDIEKNAQANLHRSQKQKSTALMEELDVARAEIEGKIRSLSAKYSKKETFIRDNLFNISSFKPQRKINLFNAEVSFRAKELRDMGKEGGLEQARTDVLESCAQCNGMPLLPEHQAEIIKQAEEQRYLKDWGTRPTNLSAAKDASVTVARVESEIKKLNKRTGASAILIMSRGHLNDSITPTAFETSNASGFCQKVLGHALPDVAAKLEGWNVLASDRAGRGAKDLRKKCVSTVHDGLCEITGKGDVAMNYQNYDTAIVARYKVRLMGWPSHIPFANPSSLKAGDLQRLADALDSHECRWEVMNAADIKAHNVQFDDAAASGNVAGKRRKTRSDKDKKRTRGRADTISSGKKQKIIHSKHSNISRQFPPQATHTGYLIHSDFDEVA